MGGRYRAYPEYKDSGVEWLGEIPEGWQICKLKFMAKIRNGQDYKHVEADEGYPVLGSGGRFTHAMEYMYDQESVLLGRKGTIDKPLYVNEPFWTVDTMYYTEIDKIIPAKYLYYLAKTIQFDKFSTNTALPSMTQENLGNYAFAVPKGKIEKFSIANFLDHETAKIDTLIEKQQQLIALLGEKRQAVISHAVTKGLNPDAPMKDSGVECLGEVPAHWEVCRVKQISTFITSGPRGWAEYLAEAGDEIFLQSGDLNDRLGLELQTAKRVAPPKNAEGIRTKLKEGDVVVCITGANTGRVAISDRLTSTVYINQHLSLIRPDEHKMVSDYLGTFLSSSVSRSYFDVTQYGLKEGLSLTNVAETPLCCPPKDEQQDIIRRVKAVSVQMDILEDNAVGLIKLLQECRTALISAAVTGKIDVRNWQTPTDKDIQ